MVTRQLCCSKREKKNTDNLLFSQKKKNVTKNKIKKNFGL